jgi:hypothetical protein
MTLSDHYRVRADECRRQAETFENAIARYRMLDVAAEYERKARKAEAKENPET